jgi:hypothetical protein
LDIGERKKRKKRDGVVERKEEEGGLRLYVWQWRAIVAIAI